MAAAARTRRFRANGLELRTSGDQVTVEGYATTFSQPYDMYWYTEQVAPGAFSKTLAENPDVRFLVNHTDLPLARTKSGTLQLSQDNTGLRATASLDANDPDVQRLVPKMQRGDIDQMSFAFRVIRQEWDENYENRTLTELSLQDGDVSAVTYPANPNTSIGLRAKQILSADPDQLRAAYRALREERAGKTISAATQKQLEGVLESLNAIDEATDEAVETIAELLGQTSTGDGDDMTSDDEEQESARSGVHPSVVRARVKAFRLLGK